MREQVNKIINSNTSYAAYRKAIKDLSPELDQSLAQGPYKRYAENLYLYLNSMMTRPLCPTCNHELSYVDRSVGYGKYCSTKCSASNSTTKEKRHRTEFSKSAELRHKTVEKRQQTMIQKYGVAHALQDTNIIKQVQLKNKQKAKLSRSKAKKTNLERYGVESYAQTDEFKKRVIETNNRRYGVDWVQQSLEVKQKSINTKNQEFYNKLQTRCPTATPLFDKFTQVNDSKLLWQCNVCSNSFTDHIDNGSQPLCPTCYPAGSKGEQEIYEYIRTLGINNVLLNDRKIIAPKELDIVLPDLKIAIEYCGLYWHSELKITDPNYHRNKMLQCNQNGYRLITIFEDEWINTPSIVKARLAHILQKAKAIGYARQSTIRLLSKQECDTFCNEYHIQGATIAKYRYGAFISDELVAVMTFGKSRLVTNSLNDSAFELIRFVTKGNVPGIASKIFSRFIKDYRPVSVISYCDLRWGTGNLYEQLGFKYVSTSQPGYWYSNDGLTRKHRFNFRKSNLVKDGNDSSLTEKEIMLEKGYYRIYDCGNNKYVYQG